jgi:hypothetical protein
MKRLRGVGKQAAASSSSSTSLRKAKEVLK